MTTHKPLIYHLVLILLSYLIFALISPLTVSAQKIYWVSPNDGNIYSSNLDGSNVTNLMIGFEPNGVAIYRDKLYWTDQNIVTPLISRSNLDGTNEEDIVSTGLTEPIGLDVSGNKVYWADSSPGKISRANLDGSNIEDLLFVPGINDIEVANGKLYWTNINSNKIQRANLDGTVIEDLITSLNNHFGLTIHNNKIYYVEGNNIRSANLDGSNITTLITEMDTLTDVAIYGSKMYFLNKGEDKVQSADLDGSNKIDIITGFPQGMGLMDIDKSNLPIEYIYACQDSTVTICHAPDTIVAGASFQWYDGNGLPVTVASPDTCFTITDIDSSDVGYYYCRQLDTMNNIVFSESPQFLIQLYLIDSLGGKYPPDQIVVEWKDTTTEATKNAMQDLFVADSLGACVCGGIELWRLFPEELFIDGQTLSDIEEKVNKARARSESEEAERNYLFETNSKKDTSDNITQPLKNGVIASSIMVPPQTGTFNDTVRVAVIDTGIDTLHFKFLNQDNFDFFKNPADNGLDEDENCIYGDSTGYDFVYDDPFPYDDNSHGTHVADIIRQIYFSSNVNHFPASDVLLEIINIKSHDQNGSGSLFDEVCSFVYATENEACIINFSAGRNGKRSQIMYNTLKKARDSAGILIISSAGNKLQDNSIQPHYPSGYDLPHIIEVAAGDYGEEVDFASFSGNLFAYSNFGSKVDIVARGKGVLAAIPPPNNSPNNNFTDIKSGTSQAAAVISGVAARVKALCPNLSWAEIREYIFSQGEDPDDMDTNLANQGKVNKGRVLVYDADYFERLVNISNCMITNIPDLSNSELRIKTFPNPYSSKLNIAIESVSDQNITIEVFDLLGRQVISQNINIITGLNTVVWDGLNTNGEKLFGGVYILTIRSDETIWSKKIIKQ